MACLLQLSDHDGFQRAQYLATMIPEYDAWADLDPLCIRLQMSLRTEDFDKALLVTIDLGNCLQYLSVHDPIQTIMKLTESVSRENDWDKVQRAISHSASVANKNNLVYPMLNYLETAAQNCKTTYMKAILLRFILRYFLT